ncbi:AtpZ/AtpI family protein [Nocardioides sp.]|uniref:AtpZ/AtpI family protein n=1 Tax=Nocardioides sp. TaxID=35761 RepID=UPI003567C300
MAERTPQDAEPGTTPQGDPWLAFGYLVAGVLLYGGIGLALDRWLNTSFFVVVGILLGVGLGMFMTWRRFRAPVTEQSKNT